MVSALWGLLLWKEFAGADSRVKALLLIMFVLFIAGLAMVSVAPLYAPRQRCRGPRLQLLARKGGWDNRGGNITPYYRRRRRSLYPARLGRRIVVSRDLLSTIE